MDSELSELTNFLRTKYWSNATVEGSNRLKANCIKAAAEIDRLTAENEKLREEAATRARLWRWVERALFDDTLNQKVCLDVMACHPLAPWNDDKVDWNVDHLPYAERFYRRFPNARLSDGEK